MGQAFVLYPISIQEGTVQAAHVLHIIAIVHGQQSGVAPGGMAILDNEFNVLTATDDQFWGIERKRITDPNLGDQISLPFRVWAFHAG
jgi:hypothetical protein